MTSKTTHHGALDWIDPGLLSRARELRTSQTPPERLLWNCLRGQKIGGLKFRRQHPVGPYVLDFYCHEAQLAVELDGASHESRVAADQQRADWLTRQGLSVLRFRNNDLREGLEQVLRRILREGLARAGQRAAPTHPHVATATLRPDPLPRGEGERRVTPLPLGEGEDRITPLPKGEGEDGITPLPLGEGGLQAG